MKKFFKVLAGILIAVIVLAAAFFAYLTIREYNPDAVTELEIASLEETSKKLPSTGEKISVISWNIGYCALGKNADFILDGGGKAPVSTKDQVQSNLESIKKVIDEQDPDIIMLQEVDEKSMRSYSIDQVSYLAENSSAFALNYRCDFVPFPWPPIGTITSGVMTTTDYEMSKASRISLPCPFTWPMRIANLKRCMMPVTLPIEGSDKELVIVNFHLEAYDSGEGKEAQTKQLLEFVQDEYKKGNYVIAGGDWNQTFPGSLSLYPNTHEDLWSVGLIDEKILPEGWNFAYDNTHPTCRLLNQPYNPADTENTQYYVIDGFICSPNVEIDTVETIFRDFENSDHNPVKLTFTLK